MIESIVDENAILRKIAICDGYAYSTIVTSDSEVLPLISREPSTWRELQEYVSIFFRLLGFSVYIEKKIVTVRETIEIDVYAERYMDFHLEKVIIECKYWDSMIPQSVVHSLRTVADDIGANRAIIITKSGFQTGAIQSATGTVVELYTYMELHRLITAEWFSHFKNVYFCELQKLKKYKFLLEALNWRIGTENGFSSKDQLDKFLGIENKYLLIHLVYFQQQYRSMIADDKIEIFYVSTELLMPVMPSYIHINNRKIKNDSFETYSKCIFEDMIVDKLIDEFEELIKT
jgi:hypothetical protein